MVRVRVSRKRVERYRNQLLALAKQHAWGQLVFEEAANRTLGDPRNERLRQLWEKKMTRRVVRLLSKLNRALWGDLAPPVDPIEAVTQAVASIGKRRVRWREAREWLQAMWGWTDEQAEWMLFLGCFDVLPLDDPELAQGLGIPVRDRPIRVHGADVPSLPDLDWYLTLRPSKVEVQTLTREVRT